MEYFLRVLMSIAMLGFAVLCTIGIKLLFSYVEAEYRDYVDLQGKSYPINKIVRYALRIAVLLVMGPLIVFLTTPIIKIISALL